MGKMDPHPFEVDRRLLTRLNRLRPDDRPRWGRASAAQMLDHLAVSLERGHLGNRLRPVPFRRLVAAVALCLPWPWPRGIAAPDRLAGSSSSDFATAALRLRQVLATTPLPRSSAIHPIFGRLTPAGWGRFHARHISHHLRQFGR